MPAQSPNKTIDVFAKSVEEYTERFRLIAESVSREGGGPGHTALQLRRSLAVDYFFRVATDWQIFQDSWSIKAILHKPEGFLKTYSTGLRRQLIESGVPAKLSLFTDVEIVVPSLGANLTSVHVRKVLDPKGQNIEFSDCEAWVKWAPKCLADPHKTTLIKLLTKDDVSSFLDLVRQLRNNVAHKSTVSLSQIQAFTATRSDEGGVGLIGTSNTPIMIDRQYTIKSLGTYLDRGIGDPHGTPAQFIATRLVAIAESLRWQPV